uniref:LRRCT domain-containing protein n=1 Tax=Branchiostoma floridae TaxID=7739 RepID=C3YZ07_BRAFL|eukprot:XP_002598503.1 hypothetical protein BRAFLDRAFT_66880 [Branchiostoma floridae]
MTVISGLLLLLTLTRLWSECICLPDTCRIGEFSYFGTSYARVHCYKANLTAIPDDIPANTESFALSESCSITNVSYLLPLPRLRILELDMNCIESFSWMSLRALPNLASLDLMGNRLRYVKLDTVIQHLPKLRYINLRFNKLASFSEYELGRPQVTDALINKNPFHCDCELSWLIVKMACLQACKGKDRQDCCSRCSACFLVKSLQLGAHVCSSPRELNKLHLSNVSAKLTGCGVHQPTTEPEAMAVTSTVFLTDDNENQTETENQLQHNETSMPIIPTGSAQTTKTSSLNATPTTKQEDDDKLSVLYIPITVMGTILVLTGVLCLIGFTIKYIRNCNWCKGADHSVPVLTLTQIIDHIYANPEEGLDGGNLAATGERESTATATIHTYENPTGALGVGNSAVIDGRESTAPTTNHTYDNPTGALDVRISAVVDGRESTAPTTNHTYENPTGALDVENSAVIDGKESTAPTTNRIYSIEEEEDLNGTHGTVTNGTEAMTSAPITDHIYSIEEDSDNGTETAPTTANAIYSTAVEIDGGHGTITYGTEAMTSIRNQIYLIEEEVDNGTEATRATTNEVYSTEEGLDNGTERTTTNDIYSTEGSVEHSAVPD